MAFDPEVPRASPAAGHGWADPLYANPQRTDADLAPEVRALIDAAQLVTRHALTGTAIQHVLEAAAQVVHTRNKDLCLCVPTADGSEFVVLTSAGGFTDVGASFSMDTGVIGRTFRTATTQLVDDIRVDPDYFFHGRPGPCRSELTVPVVMDGEVLAVINCESDDVGHFTWRDAQFLEAFAAHVAIALKMSELLRELRTRADDLRDQAVHDGLTGLPNRRLFEDRLRMASAQATRSRQGLGLIYIDLDGFKAINDRAGHDAGDAVLRETAVRLRASLRDSDTAARLGGDEFAVLLPLVADMRGLEVVARRIHAALIEPIVRADERLEVGASVGAALFPAGVSDPAALVRAADQAMYAAKRSRSGVVLDALGGAGRSPEDESRGPS